MKVKNYHPDLKGIQKNCKKTPRNQDTWNPPPKKKPPWYGTVFNNSILSPWGPKDDKERPLLCCYSSQLGDLVLKKDPQHPPPHHETELYHSLAPLIIQW